SLLLQGCPLQLSPHKGDIFITGQRATGQQPPGLLLCSSSRSSSNCSSSSSSSSNCSSSSSKGRCRLAARCGPLSLLLRKEHHLLHLILVGLLAKRRQLNVSLTVEGDAFYCL